MVVEAQIQLDSINPGPSQREYFVHPKIGIVTLEMRPISDVTRNAGRHREHTFTDRGFMSIAIRPVCLSCVPQPCQTFLVNDCILYDEGMDALGTSGCHSEADRATIVLHVQRIAL
ncbi:hypothetical protein AS149_35195 [Burkholderia cenocepacia]|nr:hypothetical protein AS149_35195 [Burkholderia cenocepacia]